MNFFDNAHTVYLDHLIRNLRISKVRTRLVVYVSALITEDGKEEPSVLDFTDKKLTDISDPLLATAMNGVDYPLGTYIVLNVSVNACPDFKVDVSTDMASGSLTMGGRPCSFKVPTQLIAGVLTDTVDHSFHPHTYTDFIFAAYNNEQPAVPEKPKKPTLSIVK